MPFYVFTIGSGLLVLGFTFGVIYATFSLTEMKSIQAGKRFYGIGITSVVAGLLIVLVSLAQMVGDERNTMMTAGANIAALGLSTMLQYKLKPKTRKILWYAAWVVIVIGCGLCIAYKLTIPA